MTTVALDLLGGDGAPGVVADATATLLSAAQPQGLRLVLVGPVDVARSQLAARGVGTAVRHGGEEGLRGGYIPCGEGFSV